VRIDAPAPVSTIAGTVPVPKAAIVAIPAGTLAVLDARARYP
jgi:hypothetical protein